MQKQLAGWVDHPGPWHLRWSAAPAWTPPPLQPDQHQLIPALPAVDALFLLAAALDWPLPDSTRKRVGRESHPLGMAAVRARLALSGGRPNEALGLLAPLLEQAPEVLALWALAASAFRSVGLEAEAASCEARIVGEAADSG